MSLGFDSEGTALSVLDRLDAIERRVRSLEYTKLLYGVSLLLLCAALAVLLLSGCYLEHGPEADGGDEFLPDSSTVEHVTVNHGDAGSSPALAATQCAGPIVAGECYANIEDWLTSKGRP